MVVLGGAPQAPSRTERAALSAEMQGRIDQYPNG